MPVLQAIHRRVALGAGLMSSPWTSFIGHTFVTICALYFVHEGMVFAAVFFLIWSGYAAAAHGPRMRVAHLHEAIERERALNDALRQHGHTLKELEFARNELVRAVANARCSACDGNGEVFEDQGDGVAWYICLKCGGK